MKLNSCNTIHDTCTRVEIATLALGLSIYHAATSSNNKIIIHTEIAFAKVLLLMLN